MLFIRTYILLILIITSYSAFGQIFDIEQAPPDVEWRQINTENFQLIFSQEFENEAQELASKLDAFLLSTAESLHTKPRKISIILQNRLIESNGFVRLAPRGSEFYTTPPQQGDFQEWLDMLAIHELRHVVQIDKLTGNLGAPFFEQLAFALYGAILPAWFFEGDAVVAETELTQSGRGRLPSWEMPFRTNLLEGRRFTYQKDYMGSFKDITPGFYEMGYFMVDKMQQDYGPNFVDSLMTRMAGNLIRPYNFSRTLRRATGHNTRQWHTETVEELEQKWRSQQEENAPETYPAFPNLPTGKPQSWLFPQRIPSGEILALHRSAASVPALVLLDSTGHQKHVIHLGRQTHPNYAYRAGLVAWDEVRTHSRYTKQTYNIINIYDINRRKYRQLTHRSRLFSPTLSPDGTRVAAIEIDRSNRVSLVVLNTTDGTEIDRFPSPENMLLRTPSFDESGTRIAAVAVSNQGATVVELDLKTGTYSQLLDWAKQQIERPIYHADDLIFKAHANGIDNIYRLNSSSDSVFPLTNVAYGAFNPAIDHTNNALLFNQYQADGYRISWKNLDEKAVPNQAKNTASDLRANRRPLNDFYDQTTSDTAESKKWASTRYREAKNLINFHSLSFSDGNPTDLSGFKTGIYWLSDNLLNTMQVRMGYDYDPNLRAHNYGASLSYQRFFPKFALAYRDRGQVGTARIQNTDSLLALRWREQITTLRMDIPLVFYRLNQVYTTGISMGTSYTHRYRLNRPELEGRFPNHIAFPMSYLVYFNRNNRRSALDLAPRWGQNLSVTYRHLPFAGNRNGSAYSLRSAFYFPGVAPNHSLRARFNYQSMAGTYAGLNEIPLVSGFDQLPASRVTNTLLMDYRMPLAYPDWSIGSFAFIKRLKGGLFADFENIGQGGRQQPRTYGAELRMDMNLLRFYLPVFDVGARLVVANDAAAPGRAFVTYSIAYSY